jgi:3-deoxy-manno-octulosonate cytidylyltransferase (CMP-KDO synthetase)
MRTRSAIDGSRGSTAELESTVMKAVIVIPARWASSRFPGKPLVMIAGMSLIQRVYERAARSKRASAVYVATDDDRIADHVESFGGHFVRPEGEFQSGTDRIAASLELLDENYAQIINVQGDEPLIDIDSIDAVIEVLQETGVDMATLASRIEHDDERQSRDVVKVVTALSGDALYFSRSPLAGAQRHVGMYGYQAGILKALASLAPSPLELAESLEQLRALQNGFKIRVVQTTRPHLGVDRPEDVARVEHELAEKK